MAYESDHFLNEKEIEELNGKINPNRSTKYDICWRYETMIQYRLNAEMFYHLVYPQILKNNLFGNQK